MSKITLGQLSAWPVVLAMLSSAGCAFTPGKSLILFPSGHRLLDSAKDIRASMTEPQPLPRELDKHPAPAYTVEPGDVVLVQPADPGVRLPADQPVLLDGTIDLGRYGRIIVMGQTLAEIEANVRATIKVQSDGKDPGQIVARVVTRQSKVYYVLGDVNSPGVFPLNGRETVLDGILAAGGLSARAARRNIILTRPSNPGSCRTVLPICYREIVQLGDTSTNYQLLPGDRIYVPTRTCWESLPWRHKNDCPPCGGPQVGCPPLSAAGPDHEPIAPPQMPSVPPGPQEIPVQKTSRRLRDLVSWGHSQEPASAEVKTGKAAQLTGSATPATSVKPATEAPMARGRRLRDLLPGGKSRDATPTEIVVPAQPGMAPAQMPSVPPGPQELPVQKTSRRLRDLVSWGHSQEPATGEAKTGNAVQRTGGATPATSAKPATEAPMARSRRLRDLLPRGQTQDTAPTEIVVPAQSGIAPPQMPSVPPGPQELPVQKTSRRLRDLVSWGHSQEPAPVEVKTGNAVQRTGGATPATSAKPATEAPAARSRRLRDLVPWGKSPDATSTEIVVPAQAGRELPTSTAIKPAKVTEPLNDGRTPPSGSPHDVKAVIEPGP